MSEARLRKISNLKAAQNLNTIFCGIDKLIEGMVFVLPGEEMSLVNGSYGAPIVQVSFCTFTVTDEDDMDMSFHNGDLLA